MIEDGTVDADIGLPPTGSYSTTSKNRVRALVIATGSLWVVAMTIWYVSTVAVTLSSFVSRLPFRYEPYWRLALVAVALSAAAVSVLIALQFVFRRLPIIPVCLLGTIGVAVTCVIVRGQMRSAGVAVWLLLTGYLWADWLLRKGGARSSAAEWADNQAEWVAVSIALGLVLLSLLGLGLGLSGLLGTKAILISLCIATAGQLGALRRLVIGAYASVRNSIRLRSEALSPEGGVLKFLISLIALFNLAWALSPEFTYDALNYQLAVPRFHLESGAIVDLPYFWHSYYARLVNGLFLLAMGLGGPISAKLLVFASGLVTAIAVSALACTLVSRRAGLWAAAMFYSTPIISLLSTVAYVDVTLAMFVATAWLAFLRWRRGQGIAWILASGALGGAAVGTKPNGGYALPVMIAVVILMTLRHKHFREGLREMACFSLAATIVALPWYLIPWRFTGNPVFPLLNGIFKSPYWEPVNMTLISERFGVGDSLGSLLRLPFALTFNTRIFDEGLPSGGVGLALALLPPGLFYLVVVRKRGYLLAAAAIAYVTLWGLSFQYARYYLPILPLVVALAISGVLEWSASGWPRKLNLAMLWLVFVTQGLMVPTVFGDTVTRNPVQLIFHQLSEKEFLGRALMSYRAVEFVNRVTNPGDWVIGEGVDSARYYLEPQLVSVNETKALRDLIAAPTDEDLATILTQKGYRYLLVDRFVNAAEPRSRLLRPSFLERFATLEFRYNYHEVYRLHETEIERGSSSATNYLRNAGFEEPETDRRPGGLHGWMTGGKFMVDESRSHGGRRALCVNHEGDIRQRVSVVGGELYTLSHHTRSDLSGQLARLQINWLDDHARQIDVSIEVVPVGDVWKWNGMTVTAPDAATVAVIYLSVHDESKVCFDDAWFGAGSQKSP